MTKKVTINSIANGAMQERFDLALNKVLKNVDDLNASAIETREINIKIKIKPDNNRKSAKYQIKVDTRLSSPIEMEGNLFMARKDEKFFAIENNPDQMTFDDTVENEKTKIEKEL